MKGEIEKLLAYGRMDLEAGYPEYARQYFEKVLALDATNQEAKETIAKIDSILDQRRTAFTPEPETEPEKPKQVGEHVAMLEGKGRWLALALIPVLLLVFVFAFQRVVPVLLPTPTPTSTPTPIPTATPRPTPTKQPTPTKDTRYEEYCRKLGGHAYDFYGTFRTVFACMNWACSEIMAHRALPDKHDYWAQVKPPEGLEALHNKRLDCEIEMMLMASAYVSIPASNGYRAYEGRVKRLCDEVFELMPYDCAVVYNRAYEAAREESKK